jgi:chromosome segregation ATPase
LASTQKDLKKLKSKAETLKNKIDISQNIQSYYDSCNYKQKVSNLQSEIQKSTDKGDKLETEIETQNKRWNQMYDQQQQDLLQKIDESNSQRSL